MGEAYTVAYPAEFHGRMVGKTNKSTQVPSCTIKSCRQAGQNFCFPFEKEGKEGKDHLKNIVPNFSSDLASVNGGGWNKTSRQVYGFVGSQIFLARGPDQQMVALQHFKQGLPHAVDARC